jgi:predicted Zn-dependent protease
MKAFRMQFSAHRSRRVPLHSATARLLAIALIMMVAAPNLLATTKPVTFPQPHSAAFISREQEIQLGQQAAQQARQQYPILPDSDPLTQYVRQIGQRLVPQVPEPRFPYQFYVVNQKDINAFALPGGPVFVNLGAIQASDNEAELVGVIAHEMSHVYMRHGASQASKQMMAQLPLGVLGAILGNGTGAQLARLGGALFANGLLLRYSRQAESEADGVGARIMYLAGYNPQAMAQFFQKLQREGGARGPQFLSDHPDPGNRAAAVQQLVATLPARQFQQDSAQFRQAKQLAMGRRGMTAEELAQHQRQSGMTGAGDTIGDASRGDIEPSGQYQQLQHQSFSIAYPSNWQVFGDQSSAVTIAPRSGVGQNAVAYGVMINGFEPESRDLDGAFHELAQSIRQSNPELRMVGHDETIRVNGAVGKSVDLIGVSPLQSQDGQTVREHDWLVALQSRSGDMVYLVFVAPAQDFNGLRPAFEQMLRSFRLRN